MKLPIDSHKVTDTLHKEILEVMNSQSFSSFNNLKVREFERAVGKMLNSSAAATTNCTTSIEAVLRHLNIKGEVIVPSYGYMATVQAVKNAGCTPKFIDIDNSFTLDPNKLKVSPNTKALIAVHMFGNPCNMTRLTEFAEQNNLTLIEDCAQSFGASFNGKFTGTFGIGCHSFGETKMLRIGEGGMVTGSAEFMKSFRPYIHEGETIKGKTTLNPLHVSKFSDFENVQYSSGSNLRLSPFLAAVGLAKLQEFEEFKHKLETNAKYLVKHLPFQFAKENGKRVYSSLPCLVENRDKLLYALATEKIPVGRYFKALNPNPSALHFENNHILLPHYYNLEKEHLQWIIQKIKQVLENLGKYKIEDKEIKKYYSFNLFTL